EALGSLYTWCVGHNVPIMAHTAQSNGPADSFQTVLTNPRYWKMVPAKLRVDFGHFGDTNLDRAQRFADLMGHVGTHGENFYADSSYFTDVLSDPATLTETLRTLYRATSANGYAALAQRLMYGTDWEMIVIEGRTEQQYLTNFEQVYAVLDRDSTLGSQGPLSHRFFALNAASFLGLKAGQDSNEGR